MVTGVKLEYVNPCKYESFRMAIDKYTANYISFLRVYSEYFQYFINFAN